MKNVLKPGSIALGLGLMLTTLCYGQANTFGPPHNVIYWDGDPDTTQTLASSAYTDVIVYFAVPDKNCFLTWEGGEPGNLKTNIQTLHNAGKTVLASFGGSDVQSGQYLACAKNLGYLLSQLHSVVTGYGFDGVDIDFEDTNAFKNKTGYDGVGFLENLTIGLHNQLPPWSIITHAPQTAYWTENYSYSAPPYAQVHSGTGDIISWFNNQTYNNCYNGNTDCTAQNKIAKYQYIAKTWVSPIKLVMGLPVSQDGTDPGGDGYIPLNNGTNNDVRTVILTLFQSYPTRFGGIMGWNYPLDLSDDKGSWGSSIGGALSSWQPTWVGHNGATGLCLGGDDSGVVKTSACVGNNYQNWRFNVNTIRDNQTGQCLDSNDKGNVYTMPCNGGNYQNWEFFGNVIFDRRTRLCLQDNSGNVVTAPCDVNNVSQKWNN